MAKKSIILASFSNNLTMHGVNFWGFGLNTQFAENVWDNFRKFSKVFLRKMLKMPYFSIFFKKFNKPSIQFLRIWTKNAMCRKFVRKFSKIFRRKLRKMHYFRRFFTKFKKPCVNFCAVWPKRNSWKFWEIFRKFWKIY